ncbi:hypothetical protein BH10PSE4_BH10PSE4_21970 [soil metagenome]
MIRPVAFVALAALAVSGLTACGKQAELERPAPLWNAQKKAAYESQRRQSSSQVNKPARANGAQENIDPASSNRTTRAAPLAGTAPDPFSGPSGAGFPSATGN